MIAGDIYGIVLNDSEELSRLAAQFSEKPYQTPPRAPVVYMKPRSSISRGPIGVPPGTMLVAKPTLALLFARDAYRVDEAHAMDKVGGTCLALDLSLPQRGYYRPAITESNGDGFLVLGDFGGTLLATEIKTLFNGNEVHRWTSDRLLRSPARLIAELSAFMTFRAGDLLLIGLPGDAPTVEPGSSVDVIADGLRPIRCRIEEERP